MPKSLEEYVESLAERDDLIWPEPAAPVSVKATPYLKPLPGIRAVSWSIYGTLLHITDGRLLFDHPQQLRMQIALDKTIHEFHMWHSMSRKPGAPWEYMLQMYRRALRENVMGGARQPGDVPEVNAANVWRTIIGRLQKKDYDYDKSFYGDVDDLSEKVAYFFHANLQGTAGAAGALRTLSAVAESGIVQGVLADAQPFTLIQMLRGFAEQGTLPAPERLFHFDCVTLSFVEGVRKPSPSLYQAAVNRFGRLGIGPDEVVHVGTRLKDDLAQARRVGMRTALYAADKTALQATSGEMKDPELKPDRLLTDLAQIRDVLSIG